MTVRWFPRSESAGKIDHHLTAMTDGLVLVVAVEVFDHPESKIATHGDAKGTVTGPWCLGPEDAVRAGLAAQGYEDFAIQASAGIGHRPEEGE